MRPFIAVLLTIVATSSSASAQRLKRFPAEDVIGCELIAAAEQQIAAFHDDAEPADNRIRLVYFYPADREPLPGWKERMQRTMADIRDFYRDGLARFGVKSDGLPFEMEGDRFKFHLVKGAKPAAAYNHEAGNEIAAELRPALDGVIDFSAEHVLVMHGLCDEEGDGRFVFYAPYYGWGNQKNGLCHAADCRLLDPALLTHTKQKIVYTEHYYPRMDQSVALFNTWYLGGTAHELGHGIGLPHNNGTPEEKTWLATSLMGRGNHHYRSERWGGTRPSFLSRSCALLLVSNPLITGSNKDRLTKPEADFGSIDLSFDEGKLSVSGEVTCSIPAYAVIAYVWPYQSYPDKPGTDHGASTVPTIVHDEKFKLAGFSLPKGEYHFKLSAIHLNGAASDEHFHLSVDDGGTPDIERFKKDYPAATAR
ncbi:MAG: hypothetical protein WBD31_09480 [Rubripirellula sp.]